MRRIIIRIEYAMSCSPTTDDCSSAAEIFLSSQSTSPVFHSYCHLYVDSTMLTTQKTEPI